MNANQLMLALEDWVRVMGDCSVIRDKEQLSKVNQDTFNLVQSNTILAIIQPRNKEELVESVRIANKYKISLYPISCGRNTGYGSCVPVCQSVLCDLSQMNRILEFNNKYGYVQIEPGVTFIQLFEFLSKNDSDYIMTATGGSPHSSVMGNALERGVGKGAHCNRVEHICDFEIVTPTGELIHTSSISGLYPQSAHLQRYTLGPSLDGLFSQSNFGIVTRLTLLLRPMPKFITLYEFKLSQQENLPFFINQLRRLIEDECISPGFSLFNDMRALVSKFQLSVDAPKGTSCLNNVIKDELIAKGDQHIDTWNCNIAVNSINQNMAEIKHAHILKAFEGIIESYKVNKVDYQHCKSLIKSMGDKKLESELSAKDKRILSYLGLNLGHDLDTCYWRNRTLKPHRTTPENDKCGIIWIATSIPFCGEELTKALSIIEPIVINYKFELPITLQCISSRILYIVIPLLFDLECVTQNTQALHCYKDIFQALINHNLIPYRLSNVSMDLIYNKNDDLTKFIKKLKKAIDPNHIISPGRYEFHEKIMIDELI